MTVEQLKKALTLLRLFTVEDLLKTQQILNTQYDYIENVVLQKEKNKLLRLVARKDNIDSVLVEIDTDIDTMYAAQYGQSIQNIQLYINKAKDRYSDIIKGVASGFKINFDGNIFSMPLELRSIINNYKGEDTSIIYVSKGETFLNNSYGLIKNYVREIDKFNVSKKSNSNMVSKTNKILKATSTNILSIINLKNNIKTIIDDIETASNIIDTTGYSGSELNAFLNKAFSEIRRELNV